LPAPLEPITATGLAFVDRKRNAVERLEVAVKGGQRIHFSEAPRNTRTQSTLAAGGC